MASDLISRDALFEDCLNQLNRFNISAYEFENCYPYWIFHKAIKEAPDVDAVEVVRCKDCVYWRDRHVLTPDGQRKSYAEMPPEAFNDVPGLWVGAVTCAYGINCGSRCEINGDSDECVFREAGDFCSRGVKKDAVD